MVPEEAPFTCTETPGKGSPSEVTVPVTRFSCCASAYTTFVIAFGLLDGYVPHFSESNKEESAKRILYVIASRARKNLYLISEQGRNKTPTPILSKYGYKYK